MLERVPAGRRDGDRVPGEILRERAANPLSQLGSNLLQFFDSLFMTRGFGNQAFLSLGAATRSPRKVAGHPFGTFCSVPIKETA
jgi:hypothetical protein